MSDLIPAPMPPGGEFLFYQSDDGRIRLQVRLEDESVWLTQKLMAELFQSKRGPKHRLKILAGVFHRRHSSRIYDTYE